jgi:hypothetical protein
VVSVFDIEVMQHRITAPAWRNQEFPIARKCKARKRGRRETTRDGDWRPPLPHLEIKRQDRRRIEFAGWNDTENIVF